MLVALSSFSQSVYITINTGGLRQVCDAVFADDGGTSGIYRRNTDEIITLQSLYPSMLHLKFTFSDFDIDPSDTLYVYEGLDTLAPLTGKYNNSNTAAPFVIQSSLMNTSGAFTFRFKSDNNNTGRGWEAQSECSYICQRVNAAISSTECTPAPEPENNYFYYNLCLNDTLTIAALGSGNLVFPENDRLYHQDASSCMFIWHFSDGSSDTGRVVRHKFNVPFGYDVHLRVIDARGCESNNDIKGRVRVPGLFVNIPSDTILLCSGATLPVRLGTDTSAFIIVNPGNIGNYPQNVNDSLLFIPDGPNCPQQCLNTSIHVRVPVSYITSAAEISSVCIGMEHSYSGDLGFTLTCPNGTSVVLDPNSHAGGNYLGIPYGGASHSSYDNGCNPANNPAGTPGCYCWSEGYNTPVNRTLDYLTSNGPSPILQTDTINQSNYMYPNNPFSGFIGCPVNGDWKLQICDDFAIDNGYLFWWKINFSTNTEGDSLWSFSSSVDSVSMQGQGVHKIDSSGFEVSPFAYEGLLPYEVSITDNYGCVYEGQFHIQVVESPQVHLVADTTICHPATLSAPDNYDVYLWNTGSSSHNILVEASDTYIVTVTEFNPLITCSTIDSVRVHALPYPKLKGQVFFNSDTVKYGRANLINYNDMSEEYYSVINLKGEFIFDFVPSGIYILQVIPDAAHYPGYLPWYYNNAYTIWDADTLLLPCSANRSIRIHLNREVITQAGNGSISGHIYRVDPGSINPMPGVRVYNRDIDDLIVYDVSVSDTSGFYSFSSLPFGTYKVFPDIVSRRLSGAYIIEYNSRTHIFTDRDFYVYGDTVFSYNPLAIDDYNSETGNALILYPNPAENELTVYTGFRDKTGAALLIYSLDGRLLQTKTIAGLKDVLDISVLEKGMYLLRMKAKGFFRTGKFIKN